MNALTVSFRHLFRSGRLIWLLYGITLVLGLVAALPFFNALKVEDQDSPAFLTLLDGFNYTVYSDFMHRSGRAIAPLLSVGRWLGPVYLLLSVFWAGGILMRFTQTGPRFDLGTFWQACSHYFGRFMRLFGVTSLFVLAGAGIWLVAGTLVSIALSDLFTERGLFWIGLGFFGLFVLTATLLLCIGDFAKVLMFREDERNAFRAFGQAGRLVLRNLGRTYGLYWLLILTGTGLFAIYFLIDDLIPMRNWPTILLMFLVQQALVFGRVALKVGWLGTAYFQYEQLPRPSLRLRSIAPAPLTEPVYSPATNPNPHEPQAPSA
ncbi:hypothetical protein HNV11_02205 [Spirosoma taeanense]|uniref:Beta-carotene 15,15'-monooxygenase n=1 Tax=Spirosoma taeanense TaxID=2735870 RepID=A0A6M5Y6F9_9BACT|nr:hypothetical protein [Spirosoma taeanense]QJW88272.1 hypothetical protein HNV11_02205 [Spirosoma taeanense]